MSTFEIITIAVVASVVFSFCIIMTMDHYYKKQIDRLDSRINLLEDKLDEFGFRYNEHLDKRH